MRTLAAITNGEFLEALYNLVSDEFIKKNLLLLNSSTRRKTLPYDLAVETLAETGLTVSEIFQKTSLPDVQLSEEDQKFIQYLERLSPESLSALLTQIDSLQHPWWLDQDAQTASTFWEKIQLVLSKKYPNLYWYRPEFQLTNTLNILRNYNPQYPRIAVSTDSMPAICRELDISYNWLMPFQDDVFYYSKKKNVDLAFMRYKLLYKDLRCIPFTCAETLSMES